MDRIQVVYIVGETRSGTTLIDRVLGSLPGVTSLCELSYVWGSGFHEDHICSCGERFSGCAFWSDVAEHVEADLGRPEGVDELEQAVIRSRYFPLLFSGVTGPAFRGKLAEYRRWMSGMYRALRDVTGNTVFIDSSKYPSGPLVLAGIDEIDVHVLHVVRDLRGFVYSMQKGDYNPGYGGHMAVRSPLSSITGWLSRNLFCEALATRLRYHRLVYDRCMEKPRTCLQGMVDAIEPLRGAMLPFSDERTIELPPLHTISGNPHRFSSGPTTIRVDHEWRTKLPARTRLLSTALGSPLLKRYGLLGRH